MEWAGIVVEVFDSGGGAGCEFFLEAAVAFGDEHEDGPDDEDGPLGVG